MSTVIPPDMELWLCDYLRARLPDVTVSNREPDDYLGSRPLIVVRDDGGIQSNRVMFDRSIGVTVCGWSVSNPKPCADLARRVYGLLTADPDIITADGSPIAAITGDGCNAPIPTTGDMSYARYYLTIEYCVCGDFA
jgi:hypothetical protein